MRNDKYTYHDNYVMMGSGQRYVKSYSGDGIWDTLASAVGEVLSQKTIDTVSNKLVFLLEHLLYTLIN